MTLLDIKDAKKIGKILGVDWDKYCLKEFTTI